MYLISGCVPDSWMAKSISTTTGIFSTSTKAKWRDGLNGMIMPKRPPSSLNTDCENSDREEKTDKSYFHAEQKNLLSQVRGQQFQ